MPARQLAEIQTGLPTHVCRNLQAKYEKRFKTAGQSTVTRFLNPASSRRDTKQKLSPRRLPLQRALKSVVAAAVIANAFIGPAPAAPPNPRAADVSAKVTAVYSTAAKAIQSACNVFEKGFPAMDLSSDKAVLDAIIKALATAQAAAEVDVEAACGATNDKDMKRMIEANP
jgi:hypothetical protein